MATLGEILHAAREKSGHTASEAAAATNIKVQVIEDLERDDFHRIPAAIYGKGFVRLYAEFLGLDPAPMVQLFTLQFGPASRATLRGGETPPPAPPTGAAAARGRVPPGGRLRGMQGGEGLTTAETPRLNERLPSPRRWAAPAAALDSLRAVVADARRRIAGGGAAGSEAAQAGDATSASSTRRIALSFRPPALIGLVVVALLVLSGLSRCVRRGSVDEVAAAREAARPFEPTRALPPIYLDEGPR